MLADNSYESNYGKRRFGLLSRFFPISLNQDKVREYQGWIEKILKDHKSNSEFRGTPKTF